MKSRYSRSIVSSSIFAPLRWHCSIAWFMRALIPATNSYQTANVIGLYRASCWPMCASAARNTSALRSLDS